MPVNLSYVQSGLSLTNQVIRQAKYDVIERKVTEHVSLVSAVPSIKHIWK